MSDRSPNHVAFIVPNPRGSRTGNEVTSQRLASHARTAGMDVTVIRPPDSDDAAIERLRAAGVDLVHGFHARRTGPRAARFAEALSVPLVMSVTGTDLALDVHQPERLAIVTDVLSRTDAVVCGNRTESRHVRRLARPGTYVSVASKAVVVPEEQIESELRPPDGQFVVVWPAHVRHVKRWDVACRAAERQFAAGRNVHLLGLGTVIERSAAEVDVTKPVYRVTRNPNVPPEGMGAWYTAADVVLNTSDAEGASNAILEAMAHGRVVLASDVPGNRQLIGTDGTRGVLYDVTRNADGTVEHDEDDLADKLGRLLDNPFLRDRIGFQARLHVQTHHTPARERSALLRAYRRAMRADTRK